MDALYQIIVYPVRLLIEIIYISLFRITGSSGLSIIGLSIAVSFLTLPLYIRAEKLNEIQKNAVRGMENTLERIKRNFSGDKKYMLMETCYRKHGYHPLMSFRSSLSLFFMIPFFMGAYMFLSHGYALRGEPFLFLNDMSLPDGLICFAGVRINLLPVLMTAVNMAAGFVYAEKLTGSEKAQIYISSLIFLFILYGSPSGLVLYWTCNNIFSLLKNIALKKSHASQSASVDSAEGALKIIPESLYSGECCGIFLLSSACLSVISGVLLPLHTVSSSVSEFCMMYRISDIWTCLSYPALQSFGIFMFWGSILFFMSGRRARILFSWLSLASLITASAGIFIYDSGFMSGLRLSAAGSEFFICVYAYLAAFAGLCLLIKKLFELHKEGALKAVCLVILFAGCINACFDAYRINSDYGRYLELAANTSEHSSKGRIEPVFNFSKTGKNVIVIFLDRAVSSFFRDSLILYPEIEKAFGGFVYYPDTVSFYNHTILSVPSLFGGYEYAPLQMDASEKKMSVKYNEALLMLPMIFRTNGASCYVSDAPLENYEWISDGSLFEKNGIKSFHLAGSLSERFVKEFGFAKDIESRDESLRHDLLIESFEKICPLFMRGFFNDSGRHLNACYALSDKGMSNAESSADSYSVLCYLPQLSSCSSDEKLVFSMISNETPHGEMYLEQPGFRLLRNVSYAGDNPCYDKGDFKKFQANAGAFYQLGRFFDYLRKQGCYDNSRIIVASDHGDFLNLSKDTSPVAASLNSLLLVKDFNSAGGLSVDRSFMTAADLPSIACRGIIENPENPFSGKKLSVPDKSAGVMAYYDSILDPRELPGTKCVFDGQIYLIKGNVLDFSSWEKRAGK